jgi:hypothetical protein
MRTARSLIALVAAALIAGCDHPIGVVTPHVEAADLLVADVSGALLARTEFNRSWSVDSLVLRDGAPTQIVLTAIDFRGQPIAIAGRSDLSFRMEAEDGALVQWEPQRDFGWVRPFGAGATRVRFLIWHGDHADFATPWLRVRIHPADASASAAPETGEPLR